MMSAAAIESSQSTEPDNRITTTEVARLLGVNESRVRQLGDQGQLGDIERVPTGHGRTMRLFDRAVIEAFQARRKAILGDSPD